MKFYDEVRAERKIRRKARAFTFAVLFFISGSVYFLSTSDLEQQIDTIKEWLMPTETDESPAPKKERA